ncbi:DNA-directed RNA polymerase subunit delta [Allobaculum stercoricanis]|uniref:DNA-directed RNA polymerase subunit delta n=1 Tax=Allobaculum stercoricanis TaxID=174709 RepID=UPI0023F1A29E|nr:DNA-directed RNA polymerase subunit delta [Allobaculum stercoricanis]
MKKSMIDLAYDILSSQKKAMKFIDIWNQVSSEMGFTPSQADDNIAQLYSDLSIDGRFASLPGNTWDLRKRQSSANTIVDTESISVEDEDDYVTEEDEIIDEEDDDEESSEDEE